MGEAEPPTETDRSKSTTEGTGEVVEGSNMAPPDDTAPPAKPQFQIIAEIEGRHVKKRVLKAGDGPHPDVGQRVQVVYNLYGKREGKRELIESTDTINRPFTYVIGKPEFAAWDMGMKTMQVGEKALFKFPAFLAIKPIPGIRRDTHLELEAELIDAQRAFETASEAVTYCAELNQTAGTAFRSGDLDQAGGIYLRIIQTLTEHKSDLKASEGIGQAHRNLSIVAAKQGNWAKSAEAAAAACQLLHKDPKSWYRRIDALCHLGDGRAARSAFAEAMLATGKDSGVASLEAAVVKAERLEERSQDAVFAKMFS